jgi:uncharacterized iron-regulated membrane protein
MHPSSQSTSTAPDLAQLRPLDRSAGAALSEAVAAPAVTAPPAASGLYRRIWRWHFYAGLLCLPFIMSLAITGSLYLFNTEIEARVYGDVLLREESGDSAILPVQTLIANAVQAYPGQARTFGVPKDGRHNAEVDVLTSDGRTLQIFVNPVTGMVAGSIDPAWRLMNVIKRIHSLSIVGKPGNYLIEIVAGWVMVLVSSGIYLWWPRGRKGGVVTLRSRPASRVWWRDLHAVAGAFAGIIILFLALSGMPWSAVWGQNVGRWMTEHGLGVPAAMWGAAPKSALPMTALGDVPWAFEHERVPASEHHHDEMDSMPGMQHGSTEAVAASRDHPPAANADSIVARLAAIGLSRNYMLSLPRGAEGVYTATYIPDQLAGQRVVHLDQYSGKVLMDIRASQIGAMGQVTQWGVSVHKGREFGLPNQLVLLAGCLMLVAVSVSGVVMWWKRRPSGAIGAPPRRHADRLAKGVVLIAVVFGLAFPLLGASMLAVLVLDWLLPAAARRRWLA